MRFIKIKKGNESMTELLTNVYHALENLKLKDIKIYDFTTASPYYDYQIVASASNERQVMASIHHLRDITPAGIPFHVEGKEEGRWLLFDLGQILVHVMHQDTRAYYNIEKLFIERNQVNLEGK